MNLKHLFESRKFEKIIDLLESGKVRATHELARRALIAYLKTNQPITFKEVEVEKIVNFATVAADINCRVYEGRSSLLIRGEAQAVNCLMLKIGVKPIYQKTVCSNSRVPLADCSRFEARIEPGAIVRRGAFIGKNAVIMNGAFINFGAYVGEGTMIDSLSTVGSAVQIGRNCHIASNTVLAGILEPPAEKPLVIKDNVFVGACCFVNRGNEIDDGVVIGAGSIVLNEIEDKVNDKIWNNYIPLNAVVVGAPAVIKKYRDEQTSAQTALNEALRTT